MAYCINNNLHGYNTFSWQRQDINNMSYMTKHIENTGYNACKAK